jgi:uroporphyrinogen decarboxylase
MERHDLPKVVRLDHDMTDNRGSIARIELMEKYYFPHFTRSIKPFVDAGVRLVWHSDGNINQFVPYLLAAGVNGFQGFQEECGVDYDTMCNLRDTNGDPLMIWGSVSVTRVLPYLTPEEVRADVRRCWQGAPRRGYSIGASSSICPEVPAENIIAMFDEHTKCLY